MRPVACLLFVVGILLFAIGIVLPGCTRPNPLFCGDGNCTDPDFPFCDVDGSLGGKMNTCIAVTCTPGTFAECRGDVAVTCNTDGNNYDELQCSKGCDPNAQGCRVCDANQTVCANGVTQTCDANGDVIASETCALGCFENQPRCREIDPSNGLATYFDMVPNPVDLDLSAGGKIDTTTGVVTAGTTVVNIPTFLVASTLTAPQVRVVVAKRIVLGAVTIVNDDLEQAGPAIALLATDEIVISGRVTVHSGDIANGTCVGGRAQVHIIDVNSGSYTSSGSGGGGAATGGAIGGSAPTLAAPAGGQPSGVASLVPLRGGCASGGVDEDGVPQSNIGVRGGGAIQLVSRVKVTVDGSIDASGLQGFDRQTTNGGASQGGGGGGGILLEAPIVAIGANGALLTPGGSGSGCDPATTVCASGSVSYGAPGLGATSTSAATNGGSSTTQLGGGGGGGGGLGRIRINTASGTFEQSNTSKLEGSTTAGAAATR